jgi:hypothetical protein
MVPKTALLMAIPILLGTSRSANGQSADPGPGARTACDSLAAWLGNVPAADVERIALDTIQDVRADRAMAACTLHVSGAWREVEGAPDPLALIDRLDKWLGERGWRADPRLTADGAGSGSQGFRRDGLLCIRYAAWGDVPDHEDFLESYQVRISCADAAR